MRCRWCTGMVLLMVEGSISKGSGGIFVFVALHLSISMLVRVLFLKKSQTDGIHPSSSSPCAKSDHKHVPLVVYNRKSVAVCLAQQCLQLAHRHLVLLNHSHLRTGRHHVRSNSGVWVLAFVVEEGIPIQLNVRVINALLGRNVQTKIF